MPDDQPINLLLHRLVMREGGTRGKWGVLEIGGAWRIEINGTAEAGQAPCSRHTLRPGTALVACHGTPCGSIDPHGWALTCDEDHLRSALLRAEQRALPCSFRRVDLDGPGFCGGVRVAIGGDPEAGELALAGAY